MLLKSIVNYGYSKVSNELTAIKSTDGNVENELEQTVSKIETKYATNGAYTLPVL